MNFKDWAMSITSNRGKGPEKGRKRFVETIKTSKKRSDNPESDRKAGEISNRRNRFKKTVHRAKMRLRRVEKRRKRHREAVK